MLGRKMAFLVIIALLLPAANTFAQSGDSETSNDREWTLTVEAWASEPHSSQPGETALSKSFVAPALKAAARIRNWQSHLGYTLQNGYPLSDSWIASDRDQAADALRLAAVATTSDNDRTAFQQLVTLFMNVQKWSDARTDDERNLRLATYYSSRSALDNDESFQNNTDCTNSLIAMLTSGRLEEGTSCK